MIFIVPATRKIPPRRKRQPVWRRVGGIVSAKACETAAGARETPRVPCAASRSRARAPGTPAKESAGGRAAPRAASPTNAREICPPSRCLRQPVENPLEIFRGLEAAHDRLGARAV